MKVTLEFDDDEREEADMAFNGAKAHYKLEEIWQKCFRPNNKHGYGNKILDTDAAYEIIEELIKLHEYATLDD